MERIEKDRRDANKRNSRLKGSPEKERTGKGRAEKSKSENRGENRYESRPGRKEHQLPCPVAKRCGSCQYLHLTYDQQLKAKEDKLTLL